jgi:WXG100 family type VII secretion target
MEVTAMAGGFKVTPEQLQSLSGTVSKTAGDVEGMQRALTGQLNPLMGGDWAGTASAQFTQLYNQFEKNAQGLIEALRGIGQLMNAAGQSYAAAEQQIMQSFRQ